MGDDMDNTQDQLSSGSSDFEILTEEEDEIDISVPLYASEVNSSDSSRIAIQMGHVDICMPSMRKRSAVLLGGSLHGKTSLFQLAHGSLQEHRPETPHHGPLETSEELERGLTINTHIAVYTSPVNTTSYQFTLFDVPGTEQMLDEIAIAARAADLGVIVVSAYMGVTHALSTQIEITMNQGVNAYILVISQIDRLILEQRIPPPDMYDKLNWIIRRVNSMIKHYSILNNRTPVILDPTVGNVVFASAKFGIQFTLESFAEQYIKTSRVNSRGTDMKVLPEDMVDFLWGDIAYSNHKFIQLKALSLADVFENKAIRSAVAFVLEPLYKLIAFSLIKEGDELADVISSFGIKRPRIRSKDCRTASLKMKFLKETFAEAFGDEMGRVIVRFGPTFQESTPQRISCIYHGILQSSVHASLLRCEGDHAIIDILRAYPKDYVLVRVLSGVLKTKSQIVILGKYYRDDPSDFSRHTVTDIYLGNVSVEQAFPGDTVIVSGLDRSHFHPTTGYDEDFAEKELLENFTLHQTKALRIMLEPVHSHELPGLIEAVNYTTKHLPFVDYEIQENGVYVLRTRGELSADIALHTLRAHAAPVEIRSAEPIPCLRESVGQESSDAKLINLPKSTDYIVSSASPLDDELSNVIQLGNIPPDDISGLLSDLNYDEMESKSLWAFGPHGLPSILINDILPDEPYNGEREDLSLKYRRNVAERFQVPIINAFNLVSTMGPLLNEPLHNVKLKILDLNVDLGKKPLSSSIISAARSSFIDAIHKASPKLVEPQYLVEIITPLNMKQSVERVLKSCRGSVMQTELIPATPYIRILSIVPILDSAGIEVNIKAQTGGKSTVQFSFWNWSIMGGDPLDDTIELLPNKYSTERVLSRELYLKYRKRKGLHMK